jgi:hypothetical protein
METVNQIPHKLIIAIVIAAFIGYLIGKQTKREVKILNPDPVKPAVKTDSQKFEKPQKSAENKISTDTSETAPINS